MTLCNLVLSSIPLYYMSLFLMPPKISLMVERMLRTFFWEGNEGEKINHHVRWSLVSKAQSEGGPGIGVLKYRSSTLVAKWG